MGDYNSSVQFNKFSNPSFFSRVDEYHVLDLMIGLNEKKQKTIQLKSFFKPKNISGTSCMDVNQFQIGKYQYIQFSLNDDNLSNLFYIFCDDLIDSSRKLSSVEDGYLFVINRFQLWKKMFIKKSNVLSEEKIKGLIGELMFLKDYSLLNYEHNFALLGWSGAEKTHKDFSYNDDWFEIKSISSNSTSVKISSIEQLSSDKVGTLVVFTLEKMSSAYNGIKLNSLVLDVKEKLKNSQIDIDLFLSKLDEIGYSYNTEYDNYVYSLKDRKEYIVNNDFPKINRNQIHHDIINASYNISLVGILDFQKK